MIFEPTPLDGTFVIVPEPASDNRGFFARLYCARTFSDHGLNPHLDQISMSQNVRAGTVRGLHLQRPPVAECKLVRVTAGAIFDVIVDVRAGSATYGRWFGTELSAANRKLLYIPAGFAHGFQTLSADTDVTYHISAPYVPDLADGILWNDPALEIAWPSREAAAISDRDASLRPLADFEPVPVPC